MRSNGIAIAIATTPDARLADLSTHGQDPKLLYAVTGVSAYHIVNGDETPLNPAGPQTLSLLMVPTSSPFAEASAGNPQSRPEEDFYLHLHLPPELDLPLPATTQIYHQPPTSYLIPRWDLGPESHTFTRIEFPPLASRSGVQEDVDTFETILAQCTAFLERAPPPGTRSKKSALGSSPPRDAPRSKAAMASEEQLPPYNPGNFKPGEAYAKGSHSTVHGGQIVLIDEEDGSIVGELGEGYQMVEDSTLKPGSKGESRFLVHTIETAQRLIEMPQIPCKSLSRPTVRIKSPSRPPKKRT